MATPETLINDLNSKSQFKMIDCPYQFGNLKISENACLKRHEIAKNKKFITLGNTFKYSVGQSLLRCEGCPIVNGLLPKKNEKK
jgi:hypothetical protein